MIMASIDDVFDEDLELGEDSLPLNPTRPEEVIEKPDENLFGDDNPTIVEDLLKAKGFSEGKIKIIDEDSTESEIDFYSLPREEQLEILNYQEAPEKVTNLELDLEEDELELINHLKENKLSLEEYLENYKSSILEENNIQAETLYDIDNYDDKELFLLDQKAKYDLSDEELEKELTKALEDEELFKRKIDKTREEYKQLEDQYKQEQQTKFEQAQQQQYDEFVNNMTDVAINNSEYYGIEIEDSEKNLVLGDILELDEEGVSSFYRELSNPEKLFEAAWFLRYGKDAFEALHNAYESEISKIKKEDKPPVVVKKSAENKVQNIYDLDF